MISYVLGEILDASVGLTIAFLTILIPLAVTVLQGFFTKKYKDKDGEPPFAKLDLHVILDRIAPIKSLLGFAAIPYVIQAAWSLLSLNFKFIADGLVVYSLVRIGMIIINLYKWSKGNQWSYRISYLKTSIPDDDLPEVWGSVWQAELIDYRIEKSYFQVFSQTISNRLQNPADQTDMDARLLGILRDYIGKRSLDFLSMGDVLKQILQWHYFTLKRADERAGDYTNNWYRYHYVGQVLAEILDRMIKRMIVIIPHRTGRMYRIIADHAKKHEANISYLDDLVRSVMRSVFGGLDKLQKINKVGTFGALHALPEEWLITFEHLNGQERNPYPNLLWRAFFPWVQERISTSNSENIFDGAVQAVVNRLFPKADPVTFSKLLHFEIFITSPENIIEAIRFSQRFIHLPRIGQEHEKSLKSQMDESFALARQLLRAAFADEKLRTYIKELDKIEPANTKERATIENWKALFQGMLDSNKPKESQS
jgi:hypothetical protein